MHYKNINLKEEVSNFIATTVEAVNLKAIFETFLESNATNLAKTVQILNEASNKAKKCTEINTFYKNFSNKLNECKSTFVIGQLLEMYGKRDQNIANISYIGRLEEDALNESIIEGKYNKVLGKYPAYNYLVEGLEKANIQKQEGVFKTFTPISILLERKNSSVFMFGNYLFEASNNGINFYDHNKLSIEEKSLFESFRAIPFDYENQSINLRLNENLYRLTTSNKLFKDESAINENNAFDEFTLFAKNTSNPSGLVKSVGNFKRLVENKDNIVRLDNFKVFSGQLDTFLISSKLNESNGFYFFQFDQYGKLNNENTITFNKANELLEHCKKFQIDASKFLMEEIQKDYLEKSKKEATEKELNESRLEIIEVLKGKLLECQTQFNVNPTTKLGGTIKLIKMEIEKLSKS